MDLEIGKYFDTFPLIIAHRGAPKAATENSARAIQAAIDCGADMIEVDLRTTRDGSFVLFHDQDTARLTGVKKVVVESTLAELKELKLTGGESIISLGEALEIVKGKIPLNLELKSEGSGRKLAAYLKVNRYEGLVIVSSFKLRELDGFQEGAPHIPRSGLVRNPSREDIESSRRKGYVSINVNSRFLRNWMAKASSMAGIALFVYTINDQETFCRLVESGIAGFFTNDPEEMVHWREAL
jgi:glycerophosphoryl diester phosphodiesterase